MPQQTLQAATHISAAVAPPPYTTPALAVIGSQEAHRIHLCRTLAAMLIASTYSHQHTHTVAGREVQLVETLAQIE